MNEEVYALQRDLDNLGREVSEIKRVLEAVAQLLRDTQVSQAGTEKLTFHARQEILRNLEDVRTWTSRSEQTLCEVNRRVSQLEKDHEDADQARTSLLDAVNENSRLFEELLGIRPTTTPSPLMQTVKEIQALTRKQAERDPATGEPLDGFRVFLCRLRFAFWTALATAALGALLYVLLEFSPLKRPTIQSQPQVPAEK